MPLERITDLDDPRIAVYRSLKATNQTRGLDQFVVEGEKLVERLIASRFPVVSILATDRFDGSRLANSPAWGCAGLFGAVRADPRDCRFSVSPRRSGLRTAGSLAGVRADRPASGPAIHPGGLSQDQQSREPRGDCADWRRFRS